jgi:uncharacterized damage-inducible protein DinB
VSSLAATPELLDKPVGDGEWSGAEVLAHLLQGELVYAVRIGQVLTLSDPVIQAYDQDAWVARFVAADGGVDDPAAWVALHSRLRRRLVALLSSLSDAEWARGGRHEERGVETVEGIVAHLVSHDREHLAQLRAAVA